MGRTVIIGGGIVGVSIAMELAQRGQKNIIVIEKGQVGGGCSYGNAGWLTPCFALPLPMPGMLGQALRWLFDPGSPLYIKPTFSQDLVRWLFYFLKSMNQAQALKATEALVSLSQKSLQIYRQITEGEKIDFHNKGLLMVAESKSGLRGIQAELDYVQRFGVRGRRLDLDEVYKMEPLLAKRVLGGVFFDDEAHVNPLQLVKLMKQKAQDLGVEFLEYKTVQNFVYNDNRITGVDCGEIISAELVILASGSWSKHLVEKLDIRFPLLGGKGYSLSIEIQNGKLSQPLMIIDKKIALTPFADFTRLAGTLELVDQDFSITQRRVQRIIEGARESLQGELVVKSDPWRGLRPCTPDGVPVLDWSQKYQNLFLAFGHQMLGLQSAAGSAVFVADCIEGKESFCRKDVFSAARFS